MGWDVCPLVNSHRIYTVRVRTQGRRREGACQLEKPFIGISCNLPVTDFADQCDYFHLQVSTLRYPAKLGLRSRSVLLPRAVPPSLPKLRSVLPFSSVEGQKQGTAPGGKDKVLRQQLGEEPVFV